MATRPTEKNGLGLSRLTALKEIENLKETFQLLPETSELYPNWENLIQNYEVMGKTSHDARLIAFMQTHQVTKLYTLNQKGFKKFEDIIQLV